MIPMLKAPYQVTSGHVPRPLTFPTIVPFRVTFASCSCYHRPRYLISLHWPLLELFLRFAYYSCPISPTKSTNMLALKKKREAEAKAKAEAEAAGGGSAVQSPGTAQSSSESNQKKSLFGVGGVRRSGNTSSNGAKKRTPGEIRIQKGEDVSL
mmetsp:Transcript_10090/g.18395  ORF Transcript_10090/g.18395 Transcript_10090/m.18395 type:complete len:153 (+) Transcript_10090:3467-3925(+)